MEDLRHGTHAGQAAAVRHFLHVYCRWDAAQQIAQHFGVDRSTIASAVTMARTQFLAFLQEAAGDVELAELTDLVRKYSQACKIALQEARSSVVRSGSQFGKDSTFSSR